MKLTDLDLSGKKVLLRADLNVPIRKGKITDNSRITASLETINYILGRGGSIVLMSHLGRPEKNLLPDGNPDKKAFTLEPVAKELQRYLNCTVNMSSDVAGPESKKLADQLKPGDALILENTRFEPGEKAGSEDLARRMANLADCYVNDAFGTAHRAHASTTTVVKYFSEDARAFGFLMQKELDEAEKITRVPKRPYTVVLGGAKVSDKILLIEKLLEKADNLLIGGGMAYTFILAKGGQIGNSICESEKVDLVRAILAKAEEKGVEIYLPEDTIAAQAFDENAPRDIFRTDQIPLDYMGLDIGPVTIEKFSKVLSRSRTIFWNGPVGVFEMEPFSGGTLEIASAIANATQNGAYSLIGGGDSVAAVNKFRMGEHMSFLSTGGGAMLTLLEGSSLPAVEAISTAYSL